MKTKRIILGIVGLIFIIPTIVLAAPTILNPHMENYEQRKLRLKQWNVRPGVWCIAQFAAGGDVGKIRP